jgi:hypothetical protein
VLGLVQDEPTDRDRTHETDGLRFLMDRELAVHLERYFPIKVDYDERYWYGLRVRPTRAACC